MHLTPASDLADEVDALAARYGGRVGLSAVLVDLDRRLRRTLAPCRTPHRAWTWDRADRRDRRWWPQGISVAPGGRYVVTTWYAKGGGVRLSFLDTRRRRYRHVELVAPTVDGHEALRAHAGGVAWLGTRLYVAATREGLWVCDTDDIVRGPDGYLLPVRQLLEPSEPFRCSFVGSAGDGLVVGEYDAAGGRLGRGPVGGPLVTHDAGVRRAQGAVHTGGRWYLTASHGPWRPGSVWSGPVGALRERRHAVPMGPEDLAHDPAADRLWTLTEHPGRRWVLSMRRSALGG
ncbi:hypothetical protein GCM10027062_28110 [Nocardioides hungaricus]